MSRPVDVGAATRAVFDVLSHYVNPDQIGKVREAMPKEVRAVWPDPNAPGMRAGAARRAIELSVHLPIAQGSSRCAKAPLDRLRGTRLGSSTRP